MAHYVLGWGTGGQDTCWGTMWLPSPGMGTHRVPRTNSDSMLGGARG